MLTAQRTSTQNTLSEGIVKDALLQRTPASAEELVRLASRSRKPWMTKRGRLEQILQQGTGQPDAVPFS